MKRTTTFLMVVAALALVACGEGTTDAPKSSIQLPGTMEPAGKGDWRTKYYTDVRGEVHMDDTRFDDYAPTYPNYYNGYEIELQDGDIVDIRVGATDASFDAVIGLYGPQRASGEWGNLLAANDDTPEGGSLDSYIPFEASKAGKYLILVQDYSWEPGELWVSLSCEGGPCEANSCDEMICAIYCENGHVRDENGCETCACAPVEACPSVQPPPYVRCAGVVTYGKNPDSGECCQYPSPCNVPENWETFSTEEECQGPATQGESCALYGRQCEDGLECAFTCPDGSSTPGCNLGFNPHGTCETAAVCVDGETQDAEDGCNTCTCSGGLWTCTRRACAPPECTTDADCVVSGCSGQVCAAEAMLTTCEYRAEYACYREPTTSCGCNAGRCGWDPTDELDACLNN